MSRKRSIIVTGVARDRHNLPRVFAWRSIQRDNAPFRLHFWAASATGPGDMNQRDVQVNLTPADIANILDHIPVDGRPEVLSAIDTLRLYLRSRS